jgi:hypothetical protein
MKTRYFLILIVVGVLILMTGCTEKELGVENEWRLAHSGKGKQWATNAEVVFGPDDKCSMTIYKDASRGSFAYKVLVKDDTYDNYIIAIDTLDEGYTIEDLKAHTSPSISPKFANLKRYDVFDPGSTTFLGGSVNIDEGELYFTCIVQGEDEWKIIGFLGPLTVKDPYAKEP